MTNKVDYHENLILAIKLTKNHPKKPKNGAIGPTWRQNKKLVKLIKINKSHECHHKNNTI